MSVANAPTRQRKFNLRNASIYNSLINYLVRQRSSSFAARPLIALPTGHRLRLLRLGSDDGKVARSERAGRPRVDRIVRGAPRADAPTNAFDSIRSLPRLVTYIQAKSLVLPSAMRTVDVL